MDMDNDKTTFETSEEIKVYSTFESMNLKENLLRGIYAYSKFSTLTFLYIYII